MYKMVHCIDKPSFDEKRKVSHERNLKTVMITKIFILLSIWSTTRPELVNYNGANTPKSSSGVPKDGRDERARPR